MGNALATFMLAAWAPLCVMLFSVMRPQLAATIGVLVGMMVLPELIAFDFPGVPPLGKNLLSILGVFVGCVLFVPDRLARARPGSGPEVLVLVLIVGAWGTALTNPDPLRWGPVYLEGMTGWDAMSMGIYDLLYFAVPFFVGRALFWRAAHLQILLVSLASAGLAYSVPAVWEVRNAPTLHADIYGFWQHSFVQQLRFGGFRPMVFMSHGLMTCLFLMVSGLATIALWRTRTKLFGFPAAPFGVFMAVVVIYAKSTGAIVYAVVFYPLMALAGPRLVATAAAVLSVVILTYPLLRSADLIPTDALVEAARALEEDRAVSLAKRFDTEDILADRMYEKPLFGWGTNGRNRMYDTNTGDPTVTDGYWLHQMGIRGYVGFLPAFLLLVSAAFPARRAVMTLRSKRSQFSLATLSLVVSVYGLDLLPNGFLPVFIPFLAGALWGLAKGMPAEERMRMRARQARAESASDTGPVSIVPAH